MTIALAPAPPRSRLPVATIVVAALALGLQLLTLCFSVAIVCALVLDPPDDFAVVWPDPVGDVLRALVVPGLVVALCVASITVAARRRDERAGTALRVAFAVAVLCVLAVVVPVVDFLW